MRTLRILCTILIGGLALYASQQRGPTRPRQIPEWPKNGVIPARFVDTYVFYDSDTDQFVLAWPENLGKPEFESNRGKLRTYRLTANRGARASIISLALR